MRAQGAASGRETRPRSRCSRSPRSRGSQRPVEALHFVPLVSDSPLLQPPLAVFRTAFIPGMQVDSHQCHGAGLLPLSSQGGIAAPGRRYDPLEDRRRPLTGFEQSSWDRRGGRAPRRGGRRACVVVPAPLATDTSRFTRAAGRAPGRHGPGPSAPRCRHRSTVLAPAFFEDYSRRTMALQITDRVDCPRALGHVPAGAASEPDHPATCVSGQTRSAVDLTQSCAPPCRWRSLPRATQFLRTTSSADRRRRPP